MLHDHVCGADEARQEFVSEVFEINGKPVLVENIPAEVCAQCGEAVFGRETMERVRRMAHGEATPVKSVQMGVFAFS
jgi:YgiT-type zinc finger domain-containing protein